MKTIAAVLEKQNEPLSIRELEVPALREGQILVQMAYSGLCQSQLNEIKGYKGPDAYLPHTLGHEGSGTVIDIGPNVSKVKIGDSVVLSWLKGAGIEAGGAKYLDAGRQINSGPISTFLSHAVISENRVIPIPKSMPLKEAALLGCALPTGAGVVFNEMKLQQGQSIALFGLGGIGLSALLAAKHCKAQPIIAIDINQTKLRMASDLGATDLIDASVADPLNEIMKITAEKGVDYSLEAAGKKEVIEMAFKVVKPFGGTCMIAGNLPQTQKIELDPFDFIKGKLLRGTWGGRSNIDLDVQSYVRMYTESKWPIGRLITHEVKIDEINQLCADMNAGLIGRGLVSFC